LNDDAVVSGKGLFHVAVALNSVNKNVARFSLAALQVEDIEFQNGGSSSAAAASIYDTLA
jgi:hypothetical protein